MCGVAWFVAMVHWSLLLILLLLSLRSDAEGFPPQSAIPRAGAVGDEKHAERCNCGGDCADDMRPVEALRSDATRDLAVVLLSRFVVDEVGGAPFCEHVAE